MNRKDIGKEIEVLIHAIKVHYDTIGEEIKIPGIELELITSKIRKLYEKSIVYNYLYSIEEEQLRNHKKSSGNADVPNLVLSKSVGFDKVQAVETETAFVEFQKNPFKNTKSLIGINDRFLFIKELFGGNTLEYNEAIDKLSATNVSETQSFLEDLHRKYKWNKESETVSSFVYFVSQ